MAEARGRDEWDRWSALLSLTHNVHCASRSDQKKPRDFHPYPPARSAKPKPDMQVNVRDLKGLFVRTQGEGN